MSVSLQRSAVRRAGRQARQSVVGRTRDAAETALYHHLVSLDALNADSIGVFVAHDGEPDLDPVVQHIWGRGGTVALPIVSEEPDCYDMRFVPWHKDDVLGQGRYGIPIPPERPAIDPDTLLVSLVGFDQAGNRIGRGAGYFDRYLAGTSANVIGVAFESQRFDAVPTEAHDVSLPTVVTELGVRFIRTGSQRPGAET